MVRIAGVEGDLSPLQILFYQASEQEQLDLAGRCLAVLTEKYGGLELKMQLADDRIVKVDTKIEEAK